jgi:hypothetical protein
LVSALETSWQWPRLQGIFGRNSKIHHLISKMLERSTYLWAFCLPYIETSSNPRVYSLDQISDFLQRTEASRTKDISDSLERARVHALFKTCHDLVKETNNALDEFEDVVRKSKGILAKIKRIRYVHPDHID